jgi:hypothetical protein
MGQETILVIHFCGFCLTCEIVLVVRPPDSMQLYLTPPLA